MNHTHPPEQPTTGSLVWHLATRWRAEVDRVVAPLGLTHAQYSVLASLFAMTRHGRTPSQRELADYTGLQTIYISKLVRALAADGFLSRTPDPADSRAVRLALTDHGRTTIEAAMPLVRALDARLTAAIGGPDSPETTALHATLRTLLDHMPTGGTSE